MSNQLEARENVAQEDFDKPKSETMKVLGRKCNLEKDTLLLYPLEDFPKEAKFPTQLKVCSFVSSIFDPIRSLGPLTKKFEIILQQLWNLGRKWEEPLPLELLHSLQKLLMVGKLELEASVTGVRLLNFVKQKLSFEISRNFYWIDSEVTLDWINSFKNRPLFVTNCISELRTKSKLDNWNRISTNLNPADHYTCHLESKNMKKSGLNCQIISTWDVLWRNKNQMPVWLATTR